MSAEGTLARAHRVLDETRGLCTVLGLVTFARVLVQDNVLLTRHDVVRLRHSAQALAEYLNARGEVDGRVEVLITATGQALDAIDAYDAELYRATHAAAVNQNLVARRHRAVAKADE